MTVRRDFQESARYRPDLVIGREGLISDAREQLARGGSVLLHGPAGIGKSTVLRALAAENAGAARTVLRCSATESESHLPFLALADLFGLVVDEVADRLPAAQRTALESALTGRGESTLQRDGLALRLAVLSTLRALAAEGPVLVVADVPVRDPHAPAPHATVEGARPVNMLENRRQRARDRRRNRSGRGDHAGRGMPLTLRAPARRPRSAWRRPRPWLGRAQPPHAQPILAAACPSASGSGCPSCAGPASSQVRGGAGIVPRRQPGTRSRQQ